MSLINWIFDIYQHARIEKVVQENEAFRMERIGLERAAAAAPGVHADVERTIGELSLVVKTLKRLAVQKGLATETELIALMQQVDAEDGRSDGRASTP